MKRIAIFSLFALLLGSATIWAQTAQYFRERVNTIFIGQNETGQTGASNDDFGNIYVSWLAYKDTAIFMFGPYLIAGGGSNNNNTGYWGDSKEVGAGINLDYYWPHLKYIDLWGEINAGLKFNQGRGWLNTQWGDYYSRQNNWLFSLGVNFNLWRKNTKLILPRLEFQSTLIAPLSESKESYWSGQEIHDPTWDMLYGEVWLKASLINANLGGTFLSPKLIGFYSHAQGNQENFYGYGGELSLHKPYRDDFVSIYCLFKMSDKYEDKVSVGIITNFSAFF